MNNHAGLHTISRSKAVADIIRVSFHATPRYFLQSALEPLTALTGGLIPLLIALLVDAAIAKSRTEIIAYALAVATASFLTLVGSIIGTSARVRLTQAVGHAYDTEIATIMATTHTIDALEDPEFLTHTQLLRNRGHLLAGTLNKWLNSIRIAAELIALIISCVFVWPWLLLLPLASVPALIKERDCSKVEEKAEDASAEHEQTKDELFELLTTSTARTELYFWSAGTFMQHHIAGILNNWRTPLDRAANTRLKILLLPTALPPLATCIALLSVTLQVVDGKLALGALAGTLLLITHLQASSWAIPQMMSGLYRSTRAGQRLLWIREFGRRQATAKQTATSTLDVGIAVRELSYRYPGTGQWALRNVTVDIPQHGRIALVGQNGSGKTTFLDLLLGLREPTEGMISYHKDKEKHITAVFQEFRTYNHSIEENITLGNPAPRTDTQALDAAIKDAQLQPILDQLDDGLATTVGTGLEHVQGLSRGQKQRLAIARARYKKHSTLEPIITAYDEMTSALDPHAEAELNAILLENAPKEVLTLYVTHRMAVTRHADYILVFDRGHLIEQGTHAELLALGGHYAKLYHAQAEDYLA